MAPWTTADIPTLDGTLAVVTGANSGLGYETALALAGAGASVILACRDEGRGSEALARIRAVHPDVTVSLERLDLADLASIRVFASGFSDRYDRLDLLINNAGVMAIPRRETADGFEMQFGTNHLGHFALTGLLLDRLLARPGARVVTVSSTAARMGRIRFDDLQGDHRYRKWSAYGQAKLANQLFALELDRRARGAGVGLISVAAHPGWADTNLQAVGPRMSGSSLMERLSGVGNRMMAQPAAAGALPSLYAATAPGVTGGRYFGPDGPFQVKGHPKQVPFLSAAKNPDTAWRLWEVSEQLTGVRFTALDPG